MILEIIEGPETGRREPLLEGHTVSFGRTESAMRILAADPGISALHFTLSLSSGTLRFQNFSHTNGTLVNGTRVEAAVLNAGDLLRAGTTVFAVIGPPPSPYPALMRVGGWGLNIVPEGWSPLEGVGLIGEEGPAFRPSATAHEELLPAEKTLRDYVETQIAGARTRLEAPEFQGPAEARMEGSAEALLLTVESDAAPALRVTQRQIYALSGGVVGILTLSGLAAANQDLIEIVRGASFYKPPSCY